MLRCLNDIWWYLMFDAFRLDLLPLQPARPAVSPCDHPSWRQQMARSWIEISRDQTISNNIKHKIYIYKSCIASTSFKIVGQKQDILWSSVMLLVLLCGYILPISHVCAMFEASRSWMKDQQQIWGWAPVEFDSCRHCSIWSLQLGPWSFERA